MYVCIDFYERQKKYFSSNKVVWTQRINAALCAFKVLEVVIGSVLELSDNLSHR